ncbi:unnamed protein product [Paramecium sonneborni]|uniref:Uncharacterized protein n=1 Tax=Paramecium sonneborni TaxID=65129 RepID=A0A8S1Q5F4_9CILI|nr:unnamed protein product [Paramecium sonneborni]
MLNLENSIRKSLPQNEALPQIQYITLKQLEKQRKVNFNVMLSLPYLLKDQQLEDRKDTIAIFRKRKQETNTINKNKPQLLNNGRIHFTEFWSEKYQCITLKDSQINKDLNKYRQIIKTNIKDYLSRYEKQVKDQLKQVRDQNYTVPVKDFDSDDETVKHFDTINQNHLTRHNTEADILAQYNKNQDLFKKPYMRYLNKSTRREVKKDYILKLEDMMSKCDDFKYKSLTSEQGNNSASRKINFKRQSQNSLMKKLMNNQSTNLSRSNF